MYTNSSPEPSLVAYVISTIITWAGSILGVSGLYYFIFKEIPVFNVHSVADPDQTPHFVASDMDHFISHYT